MKIVLFISLLDQVGGAELATLRLAEHLMAVGHEVSILTTQGLKCWIKWHPVIDYAKGVRIVRLPVWQRNPDIFRWMLAAEAAILLPLSLRSIQVMHLRGLTQETLSIAEIARRMGIKTVCTPMASGISGDAGRLRKRRINATAFDRIAALTEPMRAEIVELGYPPEQTCVISNGVDTGFFAPPKRQLAEAHVVFVGQFRPEKRVDVLLKAWASARTHVQGVRLTLVGGGQHLMRYQQMAKALGIEATFTPLTDAVGVRAALQEGSIFVMPGVSEGMSNALLEAMAIGLAPVAADTPANRAVIMPEANGLVYDAESPAALAAQLRRLIDNPILRQRLGAAACETVVQRFQMNHVTAQYIKLYERLIGNTWLGEMV